MVAQGDVSVSPHPSSTGTPFSSNQRKAGWLIGAAALKANRSDRSASRNFASFFARTVRPL